MRVAIVAALALLVASATAHAYPVFQFSSSQHCGDCHLSPTGGGLLNVYGRSESGATISWAGDGAPLHGAVTMPDWLSVGASLRAAAVGIARDGDENQIHVFPMQADVYGRVEKGPLSLNATLGLNGAARNRPAGADLGSYLISREHYAMYQAAPGSPYVRVGRFFPALGLRGADHTALERRVYDQYTAEEPYAIGAGGETSHAEIHAAVFTKNPWGAGPQPYGVAAYYERFLGDAGSVAGETRIAYTSDDLRILLGAIGKRWIAPAKLLVTGELALQQQRFSGASFSRMQLLGYAGVTRVMLPGLAIGVVGQRWDPDVALGGSARTTAELNIQVFPLAHFELHVLARAGWSGAFVDPATGVALFQVHYYP